MKRLLIVVVVLLTAIVSSCSKPEFGSSINDIVGTEWSWSWVDNEIELTIVLKFYSNNVVKSFIDDIHGIVNNSGTFEYLISTKTLSFKGLSWYYIDTGKLSFTITGAHIIDEHVMEVVMKSADGEVLTDYFYR